MAEELIEGQVYEAKYKGETYRVVATKVGGGVVLRDGNVQYQSLAHAARMIRNHSKSAVGFWTLVDTIAPPAAKPAKHSKAATKATKPAAKATGRTPASKTVTPGAKPERERVRQHVDHAEPAVGTVLVGKYKGEEYRCTVVQDGEGIGYRLDNEITYSSLSRAGREITGSAVNGWRFWHEPAATAAA